MGTIDVAYNVDATALFYSRPTPDKSDLITDLNAHLSGMTDCHMQMSTLSHADWWLLSCAEFHIMIAFSDAPSKDPRIARAATAAVCDLRRFDYGQVVEGHQAALHIEVGDGSAPLPPEARTIMQEFGEGRVCDPALKMKALHWTAQFIAQHPGFLALHFGPSDRLFCPDEVTEATHEDTPVSLLMHPVPSLPVPGPNGSDGYHLEFKNAHHLGGAALSLEGIPVSIPLRTSVTLLTTLFRARARGKVALEHGKVIKPSPKLALYARAQAPSPDAPHGRMILSFWKTAGHDMPAPAPVAAEVVDKATPDVAPKVVAQKTPARKGETPAAPLQLAEFAKVVLSPAIVSKDARAAMHESPRDLADVLIKQADEKITTRPVQDESKIAQFAPVDADPDESDLPRRKGPHMWLLRKLKAVPMDNRAKIASLAILVGLQFFWAPYEGFTAGLERSGTQTAQVQSGAMGRLQAYVSD